MDNILKSLNELHDKWDSKGGLSGDDKYDDALYYCINDLADLIVKYEKEQVDAADKKACVMFVVCP